MRREHDTKIRRLTTRLHDAIRRVGEVEWEIREMEEGWDGPPLNVNPAQYEHDWVQFANVVRARTRSMSLQLEREVLREIIRAIRRKLAEVEG